MRPRNVPPSLRFRKLPHLRNTVDKHNPVSSQQLDPILVLPSMPSSKLLRRGGCWNWKPCTKWSNFRDSASSLFSFRRGFLGKVKPIYCSQNTYLGQRSLNLLRNAFWCEVRGSTSCSEAGDQEPQLTGGVGCHCALSCSRN